MSHSTTPIRRQPVWRQALAVFVAGIVAAVASFALIGAGATEANADEPERMFISGNEPARMFISSTESARMFISTEPAAPGATF